MHTDDAALNGEKATVASEFLSAVDLAALDKALELEDAKRRMDTFQKRLKLARRTIHATDTYKKVAAELAELDRYKANEGREDRNLMARVNYQTEIEQNEGRSVREYRRGLTDAERENHRRAQDTARKAKSRASLSIEQQSEKRAADAKRKRDARAAAKSGSI